jgi:hypothetical protein
MVWFRKRLSAKILNEINDEMCRRAAQPEEETTDDSSDDDEPHGGTLILDATCAPADIAYPTDANLLAEAVEKTDEMIDRLHKPHKGKQPRPRTYRKKSKKQHNAFIKQRTPSKKEILSIIRSLLGYLRRNMEFIDKMLDSGGEINNRDTNLLENVRTLYEQQYQMYKQKTHSVENRIVSLNQPHIRPIPRGKTNAKTEFGAKLAISVVGGYTFADHISYDNFNEGVLLAAEINMFKERFGMLPARIIADTIYRNRENRALCKEQKIKLSGLPLGRRNAEKYRQQLKDYLEDCGIRNEIEGKIGTAKTRYGMDRIRAKLPGSGMSVIVLSLMAMNLSKLAKAFLRRYWQLRVFNQELVAAVS